MSYRRAETWNNNIKNYDNKVYICPFSSSVKTNVDNGGSNYTLKGLAEAVAGGTQTLATLLAAKDSEATDFLFEEIGELKRDQIINNYKPKTTENGNNVGEIVIDSEGTFGFTTLIYHEKLRTYLETIRNGGEDVCFLIVDINSTDDYAELILDLDFDFNDNVKGASTWEIAVDIKKKVKNYGEWAIIL